MELWVSKALDQVAEENEIQQVVPALLLTHFIEAVSANTEICQFNNILLSSGKSVIAYQNAMVPSGQSCLSQTRTCNNGVLSGPLVLVAVVQEVRVNLASQVVEHGASVCMLGIA